MMTTSAMQDKVFEVLSKRELSEVVEQLRPNSVFSIDAMRDDLLDIYSECKTPKEFLDIVKHAVFSILTQ